MSELKPLPREREGVVKSFLATPSVHRMKRVGLVSLAGLGLVLTMYFSLFVQSSDPIPLKWFPDIRPVAIFGSALLVGLYSSFGPSARRSHFLYFTLGLTVLFHLDQATVHWIFSYSGPVGDTRVDLVRVGGSLLSIACALLVQADHHAVSTARDLLARGVPVEEAERALRSLWSGAQSRILSLAAAAGVLALVVRVLELAFGNRASFGAWGGLLLGGFVVGFVAVAAWRAGARATRVASP